MPSSGTLMRKGRIELPLCSVAPATATEGRPLTEVPAAAVATVWAKQGVARRTTPKAPPTVASKLRHAMRDAPSQPRVAWPVAVCIPCSSRVMVNSLPEELSVA